MERKSIFGSVGYIMKKETLANYSTSEQYGVLVLEDMAPFPGYYEFFNIPTNNTEILPRSVFLVLKSGSLNRICEDSIIRKTIKIKNEHNITAFDAAIAELSLFNDKAIAIRIKLNDITLLSDIIEAYKTVGLEFSKYKKIPQFDSLIKVRRWIEMEENISGICTDLDQADTFYIGVSHSVSWEEFEKITVKIKNNFKSVHFDAALAATYNKKGLQDYVRVYDREPTNENLQLLKDKYDTEINRLFQ